MNPKTEQILTKHSDHKHSVRFDGDGGPNNALQSVYLRREPFPNLSKAKEIRVTIEVIYE